MGKPQGDERLAEVQYEICSHWLIPEIESV